MATPATSALERLRSMTVADAMCPRVVVVPWCATMELAAAMLSESGVSDAPVVDDMGRCIGMLSATHFLAFAMRRRTLAECRCDFEEENEQREETRDSVGRYSTPVVQSIAPHKPLSVASQLMRANRTHQLIVVDDRNVPIGALSSLDVLAALDAGIDEAAGAMCSETID